MLKKIFVPLMLAVACALLLAACGSSDNASNASNANTTKSTSTTTTTSSPSTTTTTTTTTSPTTTSSPTTTASSGDKTGVPECDDYLTKLQACIAKLPAQVKQMWDSNYEQYKDQWRKAASTPEARAQLAQTCKQITDSTRQAVKPLGCDF